MSLLAINDLCVSYRTRRRDIPAVVDLSLHIQAGECVGLVGESGCGKSTVALAVMQYLGPHGVMRQGQIVFQGRDLRRLRRRELRRIRGAQIAMVYQDPAAALHPSLTIATQLLEVLRTHAGMKRREARDRVRQMLTAVQLADTARLLASYPHQLSGGQQQRVLIAMALLTRPALLLLDEPTTALDVTVEAGIIELIHQLRQQFGTSMLFISHNLGVIRAVCERVYVMYAGEIVEEGPTPAIFRAPRHPYTRGLMAALPRLDTSYQQHLLCPLPGHLPAPQQRPPGCVYGPRCPVFQDHPCATTVPTMTGVSGTHRLRCHRWQEIVWQEGPAETLPPVVSGSPSTETPLLRVDGLSKDYPLPGRLRFRRRGGERCARANDAVSFTVGRGETVALIGESGSGKSTVARILLGLETATSGHAFLSGVDLAGQPVRQRIPAQRRAIQMVFQHPQETLNPRLPIGRQLARALLKSGQVADRRALREHVEDLLTRVHLPIEVARSYPGQLSGGQQQRVAIARAFSGSPALVVADEPVSALDVSLQAVILHLLLAQQRQHRTALLLISHDLGVVRYMADRVVVMYLGQVMESGTTNQIFAPPYHPYTEALLAAIPLTTPSLVKTPIVLSGILPSNIDPPQGCPFVSRCPRKLGPVCEIEHPAVQEHTPGHTIACHIPLATLRQGAPVLRRAASDDTE
jgi:peptide/nickel transport system ATP-binding protein